MAIVNTLNKQEFVNMFADYNRADNFSIIAREMLFDYYDDLSEDIGTPFEMDVIAICCDWSEYNVNELLNDYSNLLDDDDLAECEDDGEKLEYIESVLQDHTSVLRVDGDSLLVMAF